VTPSNIESATIARDRPQRPNPKSKAGAIDPRLSRDDDSANFAEGWRGAAAGTGPNRRDSVLWLNDKPAGQSAKLALGKPGDRP